MPELRDSQQISLLRPEPNTLPTFELKMMYEFTVHPYYPLSYPWVSPTTSLCAAFWLNELN